MSNRMSDRYRASRELDFAPSGEMSPEAMTVAGLVGGLVVGAGLMHLAQKNHWLGIGLPAAPAAPPVTPSSHGLASGWIPEVAGGLFSDPNMRFFFGVSDLDSPEGQRRTIMTSIATAQASQIIEDSKEYYAAAPRLLFSCGSGGLSRWSRENPNEPGMCRFYYHIFSQPAAGGSVYDLMSVPEAIAIKWGLLGVLQSGGEGNVAELTPTSVKDKMAYYGSRFSGKR